MKNKFCVIGDKGVSHPVQRTWLATKEKAEAHAQKLMANQVKKGGEAKALFIMECVSIVGIQQPRYDVFKPEEFETHLDADDDGEVDL